MPPSFLSDQYSWLFIDSQNKSKSSVAPKVMSSILRVEYLVDYGSNSMNRPTMPRVNYRMVSSKMVTYVQEIGLYKADEAGSHRPEAEQNDS